MTLAPRRHSDSRVMEGSGEVKKEPEALGSSAYRDAVAGKEGGRIVKRKRVASESEQGQKRCHGVNGLHSSSRTPSKPKSAKDGGVVNSTFGKRKRAVMAEEAIDPDSDAEYGMMNAVQALFELNGAGSSQKESSRDAGGVKWAGKKTRTGRSKKTDSCPNKLSSSSTTSATVTDVPEVWDSSTSFNHQVAPCKFIEGVVETVNLVDESEADADARSTDMSPYGLDRGYRLLSQSSLESTLLDSRATSPSSPLRVLKPDAALIPKDEDLLQFGFQRITLVRPVNKPSILRKPKTEENCAISLDEVKEVKISLKAVQRRKPRAPNSKGQPLLQEVHDVAIASSTTLLKECIEENKFHVPVTLNLFEPVKVEAGRVKVEGRELYQTVSSTQGRLRSTLSEAEKEARRLRRVQANRESARQTIKRKQVLCEDLARKAGELQTEKENLAQSLELKSKELRNHQEINRHLKEQILLQAGSAEVPLSTTKASTMTPPVPATVPCRGMPLLPYWWAFALAQSMAAASQSAAPPQGGEGAVGSPDFNTIVAATVAALNTPAGMNPNLWMNMMGNMPSQIQIPGTVPMAEPHPTVPHSAARSAGTPEPLLKPSMAGAPRPVSSFGEVTHGPELRNWVPSLLITNEGGVTNVDPVSRSQMNGKISSASMPSNPNTRGKYHSASLAQGVPPSLTRAGSGMPQVHVAGDGMANTSTTLSLGLGSGSHQSHPGRADQMKAFPHHREKLRFYPTMGNPVIGYLGPRLPHQSEAAALATEARRRRVALKRTKSLQSQLQQEKKLASAKSL